MKETTAVIVTRRHHYGVSCGRWGTTSYEVEDSGDNATLLGLSFEVLGLETGDGDRFQVTIKRLKRKRKGPRFPKNAWLTRRRR